MAVLVSKAERDFPVPSRMAFERGGHSSASRLIAAAILLLGSGRPALGQWPSLDSIVELPNAAIDEVSLTATQIVSGESLRGLRTIAVAQGILLVAVRRGTSDTHLQLYDLKRGGRPIPLAASPQIRFRVVWGLSVDRNGHDFWAFDPEFRTVTRLSTKIGLDGASALFDDRVVHLEPGPALVSGLWLGREYWAVGALPQGRFIRYSADGRTVGVVGTTPGPKTSEPILASEILTGAMTAQPGGSRIALACRLAGRLEIMDPAGSLIVLANVPHTFEAQPRLHESDGQTHASYRPDRYLGYIDVRSTQRFIYALFSGRVRTQALARGSMGRFVHVFDWDGRRIRVLRLPEDARSIYVEADDSRLFFAHEVPAEVYVAAAVLPDFAGGGPRSVKRQQ